MKIYQSGCLICGKDLKYFTTAIDLDCVICKGKFSSTASCEDEHFVCDACHSKAGYEHISDFALNTESQNPILMARKIMNNKFINMHGPEHHYLIPAVLLTAYKNSGGELDLEKALFKAEERSKQVPGGTCGFWGACGAGIGSGIFISIISSATPLSEQEWKLANKMSSLSLESISEHGGPRCCKRNTYLSILTAIDFVEENFQVSMEKPAKVECSFFKNNPSCRKEKCLFYPL